MSVADLPHALLEELIEWTIVSALDAWPSNARGAGRPPMAIICAAARVSSLWRVEIEAACKRALDRVWLTFVPLDRVWWGWRNYPLTWRARIALGFHEAYAKAHGSYQVMY